MKDCLNGYSTNEISTYFAESDESLKKCAKCPHFQYEDGLTTCDKLNSTAKINKQEEPKIKEIIQ